MLGRVRRTLDALSGTAVSSKSVAGSSLLLHLGRSGSSQPSTTVWLDPGWRYERRGCAVVGSGDFPVVEDESDKPAFDRVCRLLDDLHGMMLQSAEVSLPSYDLSLSFAGDRRILGFALTVVDLDWPNWQLHDLAGGVRYNITTQGISVEPEVN